MTVVHTSRSKLSRTNSKELSSAVMAACCTSCEGSSFRAPWMTAVRISFERTAKISGFLKESQNHCDRRDRMAAHYGFADIPNRLQSSYS